MGIRGIFLIFSPTKGVEQLGCVWVGLNRCEGGLVTIKVQFKVNYTCVENFDVFRKRSGTGAFVAVEGVRVRARGG